MKNIIIINYYTTYTICFWKKLIQFAVLLTEKLITPNIAIYKY